MVKINLEIKVEVVEFIDGSITKFYFEDQLYSVNNGANKKPKNNIKIQRHKYKRYSNCVDKYIKTNNIQEFTLEKFFDDNPHRRYEKERIEKYLSKMCDDKTLIQMGNKRFMVNPKAYDIN